MASTPPPHCSITPSKPNQTHQYAQNPNLKSQRQAKTHHKVSLAKPSPSPPARTAAAAGPSSNPAFHSLCPLPAPKSELAAVFCGRRCTRVVSKMHLGRPKTSVGSRHSFQAEEALQQAVQSGSDDLGFQNVLLGFERKLSGSDDYTFMVRELGNRGEISKAITCFEFAVARERRKTEQGKLTSAMISTLGRLGKVEAAKRVFDTALRSGYGSTVYTYSALISAYGRSGLWEEATAVLESMKDSGLTPNLVTYNAVIDACGKGGAGFDRVVEIFSEMLSRGVQPDRITYNSLLAVCSRGGQWEAARNLFDEMADRQIERDIYTYNTLLDAVCKSGQLELARRVMSEMPANRIHPNVVTYSTVIDGYAKAGRFHDALTLFNEMKFLSIPLDRVLYNTLLSIYAKLGSFEDASAVCREMESSGIGKDVVSYNALIAGYGKLGKYEEVERVYRDMKAERVSPNLLTYSTLIDVYSKGGLYREAMEVFREFKRAGLKADVVLYSELINALCKNGMVGSAVSLLDEMTKEGIRPNVITYNSIIDALGRPGVAEPGDWGSENSQIVKLFGKVGGEREGHCDKGILCILGVFQRMHQLNIKPNVVTFSAILNACSRCKFEEASMLLEELRSLDKQVYGVAHGLLMGHKESVWVEALSLFDQVKHMDSSTASAFYNALSDMLWHFGQKRGAQLVVLEGKRRNVWESVWTNSCLDLHLMSSGAARAMLHSWLLNIRSVVFEGQELPKLLSILTGWGKHSKVVGDSSLRRAIESLLISMGAPFEVAKCNIGRFTSSGPVVTAWLKESGTLEVLVLRDDRTDPKTANLDHLSNFQTLTL